ncbi:hypothetical protein EV194_103238 [Natronoflexus pectinivorans]|uniref:Uncharacterized protein n=1 Tax=Natronoflexus pectinivorans TaxID=682526 RepID=A0A4R2GL63_9BACT|nr:hypothetical protein EV194_103238 [Natronoflexus pectinivorans]
MPSPFATVILVIFKYFELNKHKLRKFIHKFLFKFTILHINNVYELHT